MTNPEIDSWYELALANGAIGGKLIGAGGGGFLLFYTEEKGRLRAAFRKAGLLADAYEATGRKPEAAAALEAMLKVFPNARLQQRLDALRK